MSTTLFVIPAVLTLLLGLWHWLVQPVVSNMEGTSVADAHKPVQAEPGMLFARSVRRPLRVVRVLEAGQAPGSVGRMMISGRMADVCAELDRLAALH